MNERKVHDNQLLVLFQDTDQAMQCRIQFSQTDVLFDRRTAQSKVNECLQSGKFGGFREMECKTTSVIILVSSITLMLLILATLLLAVGLRFRARYVRSRCQGDQELNSFLPYPEAFMP